MRFKMQALSWSLLLFARIPFGGLPVTDFDWAGLEGLLNAYCKEHGTGTSSRGTPSSDTYPLGDLGVSPTLCFPRLLNEWL